MISYYDNVTTITCHEVFFSHFFLFCVKKILNSTNYHHETDDNGADNDDSQVI